MSVKCMFARVRFTRAFWVAGTAMWLAACGGGGGGGGTPTPPATISLWAGSLQQEGTRDGPAATAQFQRPDSVVHDAAGNLYISDAFSHTIRKLGLDGQVSTLAGLAGAAGSTDGTGAAARFSTPMGLAIDTAGNLYVADSGNHTIRKVSPAGVVSTVAGVAGQSGTADGDRASARFTQPTRLAWDASSGALYVTGAALRRIAADGTVSSPVQAACSGISAVAVDANGQVFVGETPPSGAFVNVGAGCVRKLSPQGQPQAWGGAADGIVRVPFPRALALDGQGNVLVASWGFTQFSPNITTQYSAIARISPAGEVSNVLGQQNDSRLVDGPLASARTRSPMGVSAAPDGRIVFTDSNLAAVREATTQAVRTLTGGNGTGDAIGAALQARFSGPTGLAADSDGSLYLADAGNGKIRKITPAGEVSNFAEVSSRVGSLARSAQGTLFYSQNAPFFPGSPSINARDSAGAFRVVDANVPDVAVLAVAPGNRLLALREPTVLSSYDTNGTRAVVASGFAGAAGVVADATGRIYVADTADRTVRVIDAQGSVSVLAGQSGAAGTTDGTGAQARFLGPSSLAIDPAGNLYVADGTTIRQVSPEGVVRTLAGVPLQLAIQTGALPGGVGRVGALVWTSGALYALSQNAVLRIGPLP
jgi:sugar lactone lactonase YvrE